MQRVHVMNACPCLLERGFPPRVSDEESGARLQGSPLSARDQEDPFSRHQSAVKEMVQEGHSDDEIVAALTQ
jgi:hypothetical protein